MSVAGLPEAGKRIRRRRGSALPLVAILILALLGMTALVVDLGLARLARRQMQAVTNSAALEGLRRRDDEALGADAMQRDTARRQAAAAIVASMPLLNNTAFTGGVEVRPGLLAGSIVDTGQSHAVGLQPNADENGQSGDMVAGEFLADAADHRERADYARDDFTPSSTADAPAAAAFLVRMRRTGEEPVTGTLSAGPPLPYLFARGAFAGGDEGIKVRAAAIASARQALSVGFPVTTTNDESIEGATDFVIRANAWGAITDFDSLTFAADQVLYRGATVGQRFLDPRHYTGAESPQPLSGEWPTLLTVGETLTAATGGTIGRTRGYVPLVDTLPTSGQLARIVAFGRIPPGTSGQQTANPRSLQMAPRNAAASFRETRHLRNQEVARFLSEAAGVNGPLLAPVLVRATD